MEARFHTYLAKWTSALCDTDHVKPAQAYCIGSLSAEGRKIATPSAAAMAAQRTAAQHLDDAKKMTEEIVQGMAH